MVARRVVLALMWKGVWVGMGTGDGGDMVLII